MASVRFGGEPEFDAVGGVIDRKEAKTLFKGQFVLRAVILVHVAPIAGLMPLNGKQDVVLRQLAEGVRRGHDLTKPEFGNRPSYCAHVTPPATVSWSRTAWMAWSMSWLVSVQCFLGSPAITAHLKR